MGFDPYETPIDFVIIRGLPTPGTATVRGAKREIKIDEIGGYGTSGSVIVVHGQKLVQFDVVITLTTSEHWAEWENFKSVVLTMPTGPNAKALDVWHPWLQMLGVRACVINTVAQPEDDGTGVFTIVVSCTEFRKPKLSVAAPAVAEQKPQSQDPTEQLIDKLIGQVQQENLAR